MLEHMFTRSCGETASHIAHPYMKHWIKKELPDLKDPEKLPEEWDATYQCPGVVIDAWTVEYLHANCPDCEDCAEMAVVSAKAKNDVGATWRKPVSTMAVIWHEATVVRL